MSLKRPRDDAEGPSDTSPAHLSESITVDAPAVSSPVGAAPLATASAARQLGVISWVDAASGFGALVKVSLQEGSDADSNVFFHVSRVVFASPIGPAPPPTADDATAPAPAAGQLVSFILSSNDAGELWADDVRGADGEPLPLPATAELLGPTAPSVAPGMPLLCSVDEHHNTQR